MVDGLHVGGTFRSHQVPLSDPATHPEHLPGTCRRFGIESGAALPSPGRPSGSAVTL